MGLGRKPDPREQYKSVHTPGFCPPPRNCGCCCSGLISTSRRQKAEGRKPGPMSRSRLSANIAKRGLLLSRGHRADLATTRPKRIELWPGSRALLSFKTVYNTAGACSAGGGVAATSWLCIVCRQSGRMGSVQAAHTSGGNLIEGAGIYRRTSLPGCSGQSRWGPEGARESTK